MWPGSRRNKAGFWKSYWTTNGFDVAAAAADVKRSMLTAPDALYVLTIHLNAPAYWCETHTNEIWRTEKGEPVYGDDAHAFGPVPSPEWPCWRWPSYHSRVLREETKAVLSALIAELRRTGLSKRIVGVHLGGYHDAQFATVRVVSMLTTHVRSSATSSMTQRAKGSVVSISRSPPHSAMISSRCSSSRG